MQNVQKYRDVNSYPYNYQLSNQAHMNQNNSTYPNIYSSNQSFNPDSRSIIQLSPSLSVPTSVSPVSGYYSNFSDMYYHNTLSLPINYPSLVCNESLTYHKQAHLSVQGITEPTNSYQHLPTQVQLNQHNYINFNNNYKVSGSFTDLIRQFFWFFKIINFKQKDQ